MQICIDVSPAAQKHAGLGRYASEITVALDQHTPLTPTLFYNRHNNAELPEPLRHLPRKTVAIGNKPWRMAVLLSSLTRWPMDRVFGAVDVFHATNHLLAHFGQASTVFTLHDLIFLHYPEYHLPYNRWYLSLAMPHFLRAADVIITPSECSRQDALKFYNLPEEKMKVIYEAAGPGFKPAGNRDTLEAVRHKYNLPEQFILHVGTIEPRKNLSRLLDAYKAVLPDYPDLGLVLLGKKGWLYDTFFEKLESLGLAEKVIFPGYVDEAELPAIYQLAEVFVYPSLYEGFGLPPLEAMACGVPVVSSNAASLPEVVGNAGLLVNPVDIGEISQALRAVLDDRELRQRLGQQGLARAATFSWQKAATDLVSVYKTVYETKNRLR
jgi:glycosyltransferase involved in cell wall biosynthesis